MKTRLRSILERVISYGLVVVAAIGLVYFQTNVDKRQKDAIQSKRDELKQYQEQIAAAQKDFTGRQQQLEKINQQIEERRREVTEKFERVLEKSANYTTFIEQVQRKAKALDVTILNSNYDPPKQAVGAPANYLEFKFTLDLVASYEKMKHFLWEMENTLGRLVKISQMTIRPPIVDTDGTMRLTLTLSTFFLP
ncbi:MAG TPA: type 4a pilus biogenesis protein PilO [Candidatus Ozemobacteraceae bacterium]